MRLFYYDKFLESYSALPKSIQKKVQEFIQKFKNDSTTHSIHLEPINTFKDPQLRTARVDLKYRAIIHMSERADIFHLLWVDNHQEAMQWAQNKVFEWNINTQAYQVYEFREQNNISIDDYDSGSICCSATNEQLLRIGVPYPLLPSIKVIKNLDDLEQLEQYLPRDVFEYLYYLLDGIPIEEIISEIEEGKLTADGIEEQVLSQNNKRNFFEVEDDSNIEEMLAGDLSKWKIFLHPSQRKYAESNFKGSCKVTGAAGTGKTILALHRAKYLATKSNKSKSILFTTFTKSLVKNLKEAISKLNIEEGKIIITNIHNYALEKAKTEKLVDENCKIIDFLNKEVKEELWKQVIERKLTEYDFDFLMKEYEEVILPNDVQTEAEYLRVPRVGMDVPIGRKERIKIWSIIEDFQKLKDESNTYYLDEITNRLATFYHQREEKPFEYIIADEIQDFSVIELRLLRSMVGEKENDLFLTGDPLQKIYKRYTNFSKAGINIRGQKSKRLKVNYRTTEEIKKRAVSIINDEQFDDFEGNSESKKGYISILHGEQPQYEIFDSTEKLQAKVKEEISVAFENDNICFNEICIASRTKKSLSDIKKFLHINKFPYYDLPDSSGDKNGIILSTFHNIKGLEFKFVILYDVSDSTVPHKYFGSDTLKEYDKKQYIQSEKALLYVAMTRAIKKLYICGIGEKSKMIKL